MKSFSQFRRQREELTDEEWLKEEIRESHVLLTEQQNLSKLNYMLRQYLFGREALEHIGWWTQALTDPATRVKDARFRPIIADALSKMLDVCMNDTTIWNRLKTVMIETKRKAEND